jgi:hypothetical protein
MYVYVHMYIYVYIHNIPINLISIYMITIPINMHIKVIKQHIRKCLKESMYIRISLFLCRVAFSATIILAADPGMVKLPATVYI